MIFTSYLHWTLLALLTLNLSGCMVSQDRFSVLVGGKTHPTVSGVFKKADDFACQKGFAKQDVLSNDSVKAVTYRRNGVLLSVTHYTDAMQVGFALTGNFDPYHQHLINQLREEFIRDNAADVSSER